MQTLTEKVFEIAPPGGVFNSTVVANIFPDSSKGARALMVHRASAAGEIVVLRPGLYMLESIYRKSELHPFAIASLLHSPSHISLESALSFHGLIPEAVYQVSSVTQARSRCFSTPAGVFDFRRVPLKKAMAGVEAIEISKGSWSFIATPLRAIADMIYLRHSINWEKDGINFLTESLRIEPDDLSVIDKESFQTVLEAFTHKRVNNYLQGLYRSLNHD